MWKLGSEIVVRKSRFLGRIHPVKTLEESRLLLKELKNTDDDVKSATHNISAVRVKSGSSSILEEANDNGEPPAARRILQILRTENLSNVLVVVTRWYGGKKLGSDRFKVIDDAARDAINAWKSSPNP